MKIWTIICSVLLSFSVFSKEYNLYLDADFSIHKESAIAISNGIKSALSYHEKLLGEYKINLIELNHRGNTRRSLQNFKKVMEDPKAIGIFGGLHSPPLIVNKDFINKNKILTFVPWAAGGPITRSGKNENWIFRLSIDDTQAGGFIVKDAVKNKCSKPYLVLENTPWGKSNEKNMKTALKKYNLKPSVVQFFGWGVSESASLEIASRIKNSFSECIFFVGNGNDAKKIFSALGKVKNNLPVYSHWGITSGNSKDMAGLIHANNLKVKVIQTKFSFLNETKNDFQRSVEKHILNMFQFKSSQQISPMSGWVHGFDLATLLINAIHGEKLTLNPKSNMQLIKNKLEKMNKNINGLVKDYNMPFSNKTPNGHEALSSMDYIMRSFDQNGNLK